MNEGIACLQNERPLREGGQRAFILPNLA